MKHVGICYKLIPHAQPKKGHHKVIWKFAKILSKFEELSFLKHRNPMNFQEVAAQFCDACAGVKEAIRTSKYKVAWFIEGLGFTGSHSAFYNRMRTGNWTPEQLSKIGLLLQGIAVTA